jgi:phosphatidylserine/phosphatidylglycerophosphate/cardiolipin synthase-like enzyme
MNAYSEAPSSDSSIELVITAPECYSASLAFRARARLTLGVLTQLISDARHFVIISAPFIQRDQPFSRPIYEALGAALRRGISVDVVSTSVGLRVIASDKLLHDAEGKLRLFCPRANISDAQKLGSHAKLCLCDGEHAYVGSANLTLSGLSENLEMGLLVHGEAAQRISAFWRFILEEGLLVQVKVRP